MSDGIDFVGIWKACSVATAGLFGILGLLTEFKDENKRVTRWGRINLAGIVIATGLGVWAQFVENKEKADADKLSRHNTERLLAEIQKAQQTSGNTLLSVQSAVRGIDKLLRPLPPDPVFQIEVKYDCSLTVDWREYCEVASKKKSASVKKLPEPDVSCQIIVSVEKDLDPRKTDRGYDLQYIITSGDAKNGIGYDPIDAKYMKIKLEDASEKKSEYSPPSGRITSTLELEEDSVFISCDKHKPIRLEIRYAGQPALVFEHFTAVPRDNYYLRAEK